MGGLLSCLVTWFVFIPKVSASIWTGFNELQHGVNIKAMHRTIFYVGEHINVTVFNQVICLSLLSSETIVDSNIKYCVGSANRAIDVPIDVHGHVGVTISVYNLEFSNSEIMQNMISSHSPDQLFQQYYFVEAIGTASSANTKYSALSPLLMQVLRPTYGSLQTNDLNLNFTADEYTTEHAVAYSFDILGVTSFVINGPNSDIYSANVEPASWFIQMKPIFDKSYDLSGYLTNTYIGE